MCELTELLLPPGAQVGHERELGKEGTEGKQLHITSTFLCLSHSLLGRAVIPGIWEESSLPPSIWAVPGLFPSSHYIHFGVWVSTPPVSILSRA